MKVYDKVPIQESRDGGHHMLGVRWVDIKKVDGSHRSRLLAKLLAATPPPSE